MSFVHHHHTSTVEEVIQQKKKKKKKSCTREGKQQQQSIMLFFPIVFSSRCFVLSYVMMIMMFFYHTALNAIKIWKCHRQDVVQAKDVRRKDVEEIRPAWCVVSDRSQAFSRSIQIIVDDLVRHPSCNAKHFNAERERSKNGRRTLMGLQLSRT